MNEQSQSVFESDKHKVFKEHYPDGDILRIYKITKDDFNNNYWEQSYNISSRDREYELILDMLELINLDLSCKSKKR